jgi:hypothetical protein
MYTCMRYKYTGVRHLLKSSHGSFTTHRINHVNKSHNSSIETTYAIYQCLHSAANSC